MLSICIPTYNCNVVKLVTDLSQQCQKLAIDFEILVLEDGNIIFNRDTLTYEQFMQRIGANE